MQSEVNSSGRKVMSSVVMAKALWSVPRGQWLRQDSLPRFLQAAQVTVYDYYQPCKQGSGGAQVSPKRTEKNRARRKG